MSQREKTVEGGYRDSFKASSILGGSQVITYSLGIIRTKSLAYLLGPAGVGLIGMYTPILDMIGTLSSVGMGESSIREIAAARGTSEQKKLQKTVACVRKTCLASGIVGMLLCVVFSSQLSLYAFGDGAHSVKIALLAITIFFGSIGSAEYAIIQGSGQYRKLAAMSIVSSFGAMLPVIIIYIWLRQDGIVPALLLSSAIGFAINLYFSESLKIARIKLQWREILPEIRTMVALGFALMATGLCGSAKDLIVRSLITREHGIESTGLYQSAWLVSGLFASFVLKAMGMEFYPRLTAMADDSEQMIKAVNQQIEIGILLVLPGVIGTITCAPLVLNLLYSSKFVAGSSLLSILACGVFLKMASYPINTIQLAKGDAKGFGFIAVLLCLVEILITVALLFQFGLIGVAIGYPIACALHLLTMSLVGCRMIGYRMDKGARTILLKGAVFISIGLAISFELAGLFSFILGLILTLLSSLYCIRQTTTRLGESHQISKLILKYRFTSWLIAKQ